MADDIDFLSGSCKQDVTDLICLSAHLNLNRRLGAGKRQRLRSEGKGEREGFTHIHFLIGLLAVKMCGVCGGLYVSCRYFPFVFSGRFSQNQLVLPLKHKLTV